MNRAYRSTPGDIGRWDFTRWSKLSHKDSPTTFMRPSHVDRHWLGMLVVVIIERGGRMTRKMYSASMGLVTGVLMFGLMCSVSYAVPMPGYTGHSENLNSVVNFAVLPPGDPFLNVLTPLFQSSGNSAANLNPHEFTYLYQITNYGSASPFSDITDLSFQSRGRVTAIGSFDSQGLRADFLDQGKTIDATGRLSTVNFLVSGCKFPSCAGDGPGGDLDRAKGFGIAINQDPSQKVKMSTDGQALTNSNVLKWQFSGFSGGMTSPVFGYQSSDGPGLTFANESVRGGVGEILILPTASAQEPATLLLMGSGIVGLAWWRRRVRFYHSMSDDVSPL